MFVEHIAILTVIVDSCSTRSSTCVSESSSSSTRRIARRNCRRSRRVQRACLDCMRHVLELAILQHQLAHIFGRQQLVVSLASEETSFPVLRRNQHADN